MFRDPGVSKQHFSALFNSRMFFVVACIRKSLITAKRLLVVNAAMC
jgi:hypothetical protein